MTKILKNQKEKLVTPREFTMIPRGWAQLPISENAKLLGMVMLTWASPHDGDACPFPSKETMTRAMGWTLQDNSYWSLNKLLAELESIGAVNLGGFVPRKKGETWDLSAVWNLACSYSPAVPKVKKTPMEVLRNKLVKVDNELGATARWTDDAMRVFGYVVHNKLVPPEESRATNDALERLFNGGHIVL